MSALLVGTHTALESCTQACPRTLISQPDVTRRPQCYLNQHTKTNKRHSITQLPHNASWLNPYPALHDRLTCHAVHYTLPSVHLSHTYASSTSPPHTTCKLTQSTCASLSHPPTRPGLLHFTDSLYCIHWSAPSGHIFPSTAATHLTHTTHYTSSSQSAFKTKQQLKSALRPPGDIRADRS